MAEAIKHPHRVVFILSGEVPCRWCGGTGKKPSAVTTVFTPCEDCNGKGKFWGNQIG